MDGRRFRIAFPVATALLASFAIAAPSAQAADCAGANLLPAIASVPVAKAATLCLLNDERAARGLAPLTTQSTLESVATSYSESMVQQRFFAHVAPSGQTLSDRLASYVAAASGFVIGENLAWGEGALATPAAIVRSWMNSEGHRNNILNVSFDEIGIGIVVGSPVGSPPALSATYTTEFGRRSVPAPSSSGSGSTPIRASASSTSPRTTKKAKRISAKKRAQISKRCHRVARRTKASKRTRQKRYDRCMTRELRAARR